MIITDNFAVQNWIITPTAMSDCVSPIVATQANPSPFPNLTGHRGQTFPGSVPGCKNQWLLVLSGVVHLNLKGNGQEWLRETVSFTPDIEAPINHVITRDRILVPSKRHEKVFQVDQWALHATPSSMFNKNHSVNSGFAVDAWRPKPFHYSTNLIAGGAPFGNIFTGILVDVAVRDIDAVFHRLSYHITLIGTIRYEGDAIVD